MGTKAICLIAGCIFCFLGFTNYSISDTFTAFFLSEILLGFGQSLVSGADSALLYDTMLYYKKEDAYLKYEGRVTMVGNFSEAFAGIFSRAASSLFPPIPFLRAERYRFYRNSGCHCPDRTRSQNQNQEFVCQYHENHTILPFHEQGTVL